MSIITGLEAWWATTEADVLAFIAKLKAEAQWVEQEATKAFDWINNNIGTINNDIAEVNGVLQTIVASGAIKVPPQVDTAISVLNHSIAGLNAYRQTIAESAAGGAQAQAAAVVAGYTAIKQAQQASTIAALAVVNAPPATPTQDAQAKQ